ncbi:MAG: FadR family transcriptional regulator [Limnochordales bacterium]|nr:FadR/GntR family transcriptional regulator [Limnochordales bacterium]
MEDLFQSIPQVTVGDEIVRQLKTLILSGDLQPGQRLPSETVLAQRFGVSRPSVREALKALAALGLVERTREGTFVRMDERKFLVEPFAYMVALKKITLDELFETRRALEAELAGLAAERATDEDLEQMQAELDRMRDHAGEADIFVSSNVGFHMAIARAARNRVLYQMLRAVRGIVVQTQRQGAPLDAVVQQSIADHEHILDAIRRRDRPAAVQAMIQHLDNVHKGIVHRVAPEIEIDLEETL